MGSVDNKTTVSFQELRAFAALALEKAEAALGSSVDLNLNFYWVVSTESAFMRTKTMEPEILVGSIVEGLEDFRDWLADPDVADPEVAYPTWHALDHLAGLLQALAYRTRPDAPADADEAR
jgi:hypothetical protein